MTTLLLSSRHTPDDQALWRAAIGRGWSVVRARGLTIPAFNIDDVVIYVEALFAPAIADRLNRRLLEPPEDWLVRLPERLTKRSIRMMRLGEARQVTVPSFIKPPNDKSFSAQVYHAGTELSDAFDDEMSVLVASPVQWEAEFRCFCLDGQVVTHSPYLRDGELAKFTDYRMSEVESCQAIQTAQEALTVPDLDLPRAVVVDVGLIKGAGWAVVEANAAWGSGIYGCEPERVLDVVREACVLHGE